MPDETTRTVWFLPEQDIDEDGTMVVEARLVIREHPPAVHDKQLFEGFTEFRLLNARRVR